MYNCIFSTCILHICISYICTLNSLLLTCVLLNTVDIPLAIDHRSHTTNITSISHWQYALKQQSIIRHNKHWKITIIDIQLTKPPTHLPPLTTITETCSHIPHKNSTHIPGPQDMLPTYHRTNTPTSNYQHKKQINRPH